MANVLISSQALQPIKTLPFNSRAACALPTLDNGKSVIVRINDRGPFIEGRNH